METVCSNRLDVDYVMMSPDIPRNGHVMWMSSFVAALKRMLEEGAADEKLTECSNFTHKYALPITILFKIMIEKPREIKFTSSPVMFITACYCTKVSPKKFFNNFFFHRIECTENLALNSTTCLASNTF